MELVSGADNFDASLIQAVRNACSFPFWILRSSPQSLAFQALTQGLSLSRKRTWLSSCKNRFGFPYTRTDYSPYLHTPLHSPKAENLISAASSWRQMVPSLLFLDSFKNIASASHKQKTPALYDQRMIKLGIYLLMYMLMKLTCA